MRPEDLEQYRQHFPHWAALTHDVRSICLLSGDGPQEQVLREVLPAAHVGNVTRDLWDLNESLNRASGFDLIVGMNVFMYSPDPDLWFRNVFAGCRYLWLQDPVCGKRGPVELGNHDTGDGDSARYGYDTLLRPRIEAGAYDLSKYQERLVRMCAYRINAGDHVPYGLSMMAFLRGDL